MTATAELIARYAATAGLDPHTTVTTYRGTREIRLHGEGEHGVFGTVVIGRAGKVLRASLVHGNSGHTQRHTGARTLLAALRRLAAAAPAQPAITSFERVEIDIDVRDLRRYDLLVGGGAELDATMVRATRPVDVLYGNGATTRPGTAVRVWFDNRTNDVFAAPQKVRVSRLAALAA